MKTFLVAILFAGVVLSVRAQDQPVENCDRLYSQRGASLFSAVECYSKLSKGAPADRKEELYERSFTALMAVVEDSPGTPEEARAVRQALALSEEYSKVFPASVKARYWRARVAGFEASGAKSGSLHEDLKLARSEVPAIDGFGPARLLGELERDPVLAEKDLADAYLNAPANSSNHLAYAKALRSNGKLLEAKAVLTRFLSMNDPDLNPFPDAPLRGRKPENERNRQSARALLAQMNGQISAH